MLSASARRASSVDGEIVGFDRPRHPRAGRRRARRRRGEAERLAEQSPRLSGFFRTTPGKMNRSLLDIGGELLAVPQFTLVADTKSGTRPSFSSGASPADGERLFAFHELREQDPRRDRPLRRRHEGQPRERRAGDFLAAGFSAEYSLEAAPARRTRSSAGRASGGSRGGGCAAAGRSSCRPSSATRPMPSYSNTAEPFST